MSGRVAKPKLYIDYLSYFQAAGLGIEFDDETSNLNENYEEIISYNPQKTKYFTRSQSNYSFFKFIMGDQTDEIYKLISSMNFAAVCNHNQYDAGQAFIIYGLNEEGYTQNINFNEIIGTNKNGFSLFDLLDFRGKGGIALAVVGAPLNETNQLEIGSFLAGRTYSFPHNANLSMNISYNADGIKRTRTLGGSDIVDVNYYKQPLWGKNPPFVASNASGIGRTTFVGRRSWDLTFSFLTENDVMPVDMGENFMFDNQFTEEGNRQSYQTHTTENLVSHVMSLTMNGAIPMILQPDDTINTFCMVRLKSNNFSIQQSAPNLYTAKLFFEEVF